MSARTPGETARQRLTLSCGIATAVLAGVGVNVRLLIVVVIIGVAAAIVAVRYANTAARYVVLAVAVVGPAIAAHRPPAWQLALLGAAVTGFLLTPDVDRRGRAPLLAAAAGVVLAGAVAVAAQHARRGLVPYLVGLAALAVALFVVLRPALAAEQRDNGAPGQTMDG
jgi:hypothetical protein